MIQRIQSLYLIGIVLLQALLSQFSFLHFTQDGKEYTLDTQGLVDSTGVYVEPDYKQLIFLSIICFFAAISTALFKNRKIQVKLVKVIVFMSFSQIVYIVISAFKLNEDGAQNMSFGLAPFIIPICTILALLASKAIKKDENLIKSVDRIR